MTAATYAPQGALYQFTNGSSISGAMTYNSRLQPLQLYFTTGTITSGTLTQLQQATCPTTTAAIMNRSYNFGLGTNDNGNALSIANCRDTNRTQNFDYDKLNRIADAYTSGPSWGEAFTIDPWGNLTNKGPYLSKTQYEALNVAPATTKNQLTGFGYDAAGNMTVTGYSYDAENRLATAGGVTYIYDGDGNRVKKSSGTLYWDAGPLAESDLTATATSWKEYVFFNGKRMARRDASNSSVHYFFLDHLGSSSVTTNSTGATLEQDLDYFPYGGVASGTSSDHYLFTGKERDSESGLDNFGARYHASSLGRFMSPDPGKLSLKHLLNPQKWNKYAYVLNNPLAYFDPDGQAEVKISYDAFIPQKTVFGFRGDNRSFSTDPNASARVRVTMRVETDPAKNGGNPLIGKPVVQVGETHIMGTPESMNKQSSGPTMPTATASQDSNGNVTVNLNMNMRDPFQPAGQGAASNVNITVNEAATNAEVKGTVSGSPSFEANFTPEGAPTTNLPIQASPQGTVGFLVGLQQTNKVDNKTDLQLAPESQ